MNYLKWILRLYLLACVSISLAVSCSPVEFNRDTRNCGGMGSEACEVNTQSGVISFDYGITVPEAAVDVLFVVDTSTSMTQEHAKMIDKFDSFISRISGLNWRIGVTTMDVSNDPTYYEEGQVTNPKSYYGSSTYAYLENYQDGNLIPAYNGSTYLDESQSSSTSELQSLFESMISIDGKEYNGKNYYSTGDERGLYTASIAISKHKESFLRDHAHLAMVFLSDEDVRGQGLDIPYEKKQLTERDLPSYLSSTVSTELGSTKSVSVYPIIVESSSNSVDRLSDGYSGNCLSQQKNSGDPDAYEGLLYEDLMDFFPGGTASLCASNYSTLLTQIGENIEYNVRATEELPCTPLIDEDRSLTFEVYNLPEGTTYNLSGKTVTFDPVLISGQNVGFRFSCTDL
ncbi:MAG: hypothetical protein VX642_15670 [Bdellovibrionota bacterium]|nr:hypothetical protein [Bdellovibrionota bacterium]